MVAVLSHFVMFIVLLRLYFIYLILSTKLEIHQALTMTLQTTFNTYLGTLHRSYSLLTLNEKLIMLDNSHSNYNTLIPQVDKKISNYYLINLLY